MTSESVRLFDWNRTTIRVNSALRPRVSKATESRDGVTVTLKRLPMWSTAPSVSSAVGEALTALRQLVTHMVPSDARWSVARQPRATAAARALATRVWLATSAERTFCFWTASRIRGIPNAAITAMIEIATKTSMNVNPRLRMTPPVGARYYTLRAQA